MPRKDPQKHNARRRAYSKKHKHKWSKDPACRRRYAERVREIRLMAVAVKVAMQCQNPSCPVAAPLPSCCLDFHHLHDKSFDLGNSRSGGALVAAEINKCSVLCAVCHRLETWGDLDASGFTKCNVAYKDRKIMQVTAN